MTFARRTPNSVRRVTRVGSENDVHQQVCDYVRLQYPGVIFHTDFAAGARMTKGQAVRNKALQSGRGWPDIFFPEPRNGYYGLFLELKKEDVRVYLLNGSLSVDKHIREQAAMLDSLTRHGYCAKFAIGFDHAKAFIDAYFSAKDSEKNKYIMDDIVIQESTGRVIHL